MKHRRRVQAGRHKPPRELVNVGADLAGGLTEQGIVAVDVADHARCFDFDFGRGIDGAAVARSRAELAPVPPVGPDALQCRALIGAAMLSEMPIGMPFMQSRSAYARRAMAASGANDARNRMRLQTDNDEVLHPRAQPDCRRSAVAPHEPDHRSTVLRPAARVAARYGPRASRLMSAPARLSAEIVAHASRRRRRYRLHQGLKGQEIRSRTSKDQ